MNMRTYSGENRMDEMRVFDSSVDNGS